MAGPYCTKEKYVEFWGYWQYQIDLAEMSPAQIAALESQILLASGDIDMALKQVGALNCTLDDSALQYLAKLNAINTAVTYRAICGPRLSEDDTKLWMEWLDNQLKLIREGSIELCAGATGKDFPAIGWAEIGWTPATTADIIINSLQRRRGG